MTEAFVLGEVFKGSVKGFFNLLVCHIMQSKAEFRFLKDISSVPACLVDEPPAPGPHFPSIIIIIADCHRGQEKVFLLHIFSSQCCNIEKKWWAFCEFVKNNARHYFLLAL